MRIIQFLIIYKITFVFCDPYHTNASPSPNNAVVSNVTVPINSSTKFDFDRFTWTTAPPITFPAFIDDWKLTKVLAKKSVNLQNRSDDSIRISTPADGDFQSLIRDSALWVDKSLLVRKIWDDLANYTVIVVTAPPKWGKSINLSMFKFFCALPIDSNGFETARERSASYQYFNEGKVVRPDGTVAAELDGTPSISGYNEHLANYPIIHISGTNFSINDPMESLRKTIHDTYQRHSSLLRRLNATQQGMTSIAQKTEASNDIAEFLSYYDSYKIRQLNLNQLVCGIRNLTRLLFSVYRREVVIVMDDYDYFVQKAYFGRTTVSTCPNHYSGFEFIWGKFVCHTFKENPHLKKALVTGVLRANDPDTLQLYGNTYNAFTFDEDHHLFPYYGIVQPEYQQMVDKRAIDKGVADKGTQWYGGYRTLSHPHIQIYSSYSVARFVTTLQIPADNNGAQDNGTSFLIDDFVKRLIRKPTFRPLLSSFIESFDQNAKYLTCMIPSMLNILHARDCETLWKTERGEIPHTNVNENFVFSLMANTGYVTIYYKNYLWNLLYVKIPNRNVYRTFRAAFDDP